MRNRAIASSIVVAAVVALALGSYAFANTPNSNQQRVDANVAGWHEVPTIMTPGAGTFEAKVTDAATAYVLTYSGLEGNAFMAHIHLAQRHANGGIVVWLWCPEGSPAPQPCPPKAGTVTGVITPANIRQTNQGIETGEYDDFVRALRAGHMYVNVHSDKFPGGEIRGQVDDEPQREVQRP